MFRGRCMEQVRVVQFFDGAGGGDPPDHTSRASGAHRLRVVFDASWGYRRHHSSSLKHAAAPGASPDRLE